MSTNKARVVLLAGQSNACGVSRIPCLERNIDHERFEKLQNGFENVPILYWSHYEKNDCFEPVALKEGYRTCDVDHTFGPEIGFAEYISEVTDEKIYLVKWAHGGSALFNDWNPTIENLPTTCSTTEPKAGMCLGACIEFLGKALPLIREISGKEPVLEAMLWMQGESDAFEESIVNSYMGYFHTMLSHIKDNFSQYIPEDFCVIDAGISKTWQYYREMNEIKKDNALKSPHFVYLDTIGAGLLTGTEPPESPDVFHYDSLSMMKLGRMFAEAYWKETSKKANRN